MPLQRLSVPYPVIHQKHKGHFVAPQRQGIQCRQGGRDSPEAPIPHQDARQAQRAQQVALHRGVMGPQAKEGAGLLRRRKRLARKQTRVAQKCPSRLAGSKPAAGALQPCDCVAAAAKAA